MITGKSLLVKKQTNTQHRRKVNMSSLNKYLAERRQEKSCMVMTHVVCGYPSFEANWKELEIMQQFDVDMVELQFPFSEPSADGPLFVKANQQAIDDGVTVEDCFEFMKKVTDHFDFKVLMMGYYNTVFKTGHAKFLGKLKEAGATGFILPDLPVEEAGELHEIAKELDLAPIMLMTPTNSAERLQQLSESADGFIYTVAWFHLTLSTGNRFAIGSWFWSCFKSGY